MTDQHDLFSAPAPDIEQARVEGRRRRLAARAELEQGRRERNEGTGRVIDNQPDPWKDRYREEAQNFLRTLKPGDTFTGEHVRGWCIFRHIGDPTHPNAWGAMFRATITRWLKLGIVERCGWAQMESAASHASPTVLYRRMG